MQALLSYLILIKLNTCVLKDIKLIVHIKVQRSKYPSELFRILCKAFTGNDFNIQAVGYRLPFSPFLYLGSSQMLKCIRITIQCHLPKPRMHHGPLRNFQGNHEEMCFSSFCSLFCPQWAFLDIIFLTAPLQFYYHRFPVHVFMYCVYIIYTWKK